MAVFRRQRANALPHLGGGQGRQGLRDKSVVAALDAQHRIEVADRLAQLRHRHQGHDHPGSDLFRGVVGLHIDGVTLITRQPQKLETRHRGSELPESCQRDAVTF